MLFAIGVTVSMAALLTFVAFRNLFTNTQSGKTNATEPGQPPTREATRPRDEKGVVSAGGAPAASNPASDLVAQLQQQAKKSDDARKAKIRGHVERPVPPITPEGRQALERGRRARLAIKHVFPPRVPQRSMSYFGGLPIVPEDFDWPTLHNRQGLLERLTFVAQVDCSDLPPGPSRELFPARGYVYFFAPMSGTFGPDAMHFVTRYEPRQATQKWEPLDMPFTGQIEHADPMDTIWRGKRTHYNRIEIEFGWIEEPTDDEVAARADEGHAFEVANKIRAERIDAFYGSRLSPDTALSAHHAPKDTLWMPYVGFPINWSSARILRKFVEAYHREEAEDVAKRLAALGTVADDDPEVQRLRSLQRELSALSLKISNVFFPTINAGLKEFDAPPAEVKGQILAFLEDLRAHGMPSSKERRHIHLRLPLVINQWIAIAAIQGAEGGLADPHGAPLIGPDVVAALSHRHAPRKHAMLGEGEIVQVAADEMKDRYLLLLQLGPDVALDWTVGEMGPLQYWITPEDLAAKRFENTVLTIEAY